MASRFCVGIIAPVVLLGSLGNLVAQAADMTQLLYPQVRASLRGNENSWYTVWTPNSSSSCKVVQGKDAAAKEVANLIRRKFRYSVEAYSSQPEAQARLDSQKKEYKNAKDQERARAEAFGNARQAAAYSRAWASLAGDENTWYLLSKRTATSSGSLVKKTRAYQIVRGKEAAARAVAQFMLAGAKYWVEAYPTEQHALARMAWWAQYDRLAGYR